MSVKKILNVVLLLTAMTAAPALAIMVPGADATDGAFAFVGDPGDPDVMTIDLELAETLPLNSTFPYAGAPAVPGSGVYDPTRWAVVFRYSSVDIPAGKTVRFVNHSSGAPVVWLVSGNVTVSGTLDLTGEHHTGFAFRQALPGPGGWRGGRAFNSSQSLGSAGFGPGGGRYQVGNIRNAGSYSTAGFNQGTETTYGARAIVPLLGGSGGSADNTGWGGGAGGGAILIASSSTVQVSGAVLARGGDTDAQGGCSGHAGPGSGGAGRIVADFVGVDGTLSARGGSGLACGYEGGFGRVRIEALDTDLGEGAITPSNAPGYSIALPADPAKIWPDAAAPTVRITKVDMLDVPADPRPLGNWDFPDADVTIDDVATATLTIECTNVPVPGDANEWEVAVRVIPKSGYAQELMASFQSGDQSLSTWTVQIDTPSGYSSIQARAYLPPSP